MKKVAVFAGTTEGRKLCEYLAGKGIQVTAIVATGYGSSVMPEMPFLSIREGRLSFKEIAEIIELYDCIVDATHPYARIITENIVEAAKGLDKRVIRVIRPPLEYENVMEFPNIAEACTYLNGTTGNILATTGSKEIPTYTSIENYRQRVFVRVLPTVEAVKACTGLGFNPANIICMQGPFSENMNIATMEQIGASFIVTKESGASGGFGEKLSAAKRLGVKVVLIGRPCSEEGMVLDEVCRYFDYEFCLGQCL